MTDKTKILCEFRQGDEGPDGCGMYWCALKGGFFAKAECYTSRCSAFEDHKNAKEILRAGDHVYWLGELLAVIHGDGGHHLAEHGVEASTKSALKIIYKERTDLDKFQFSERELSDAYLRIRKLVGTLHTTKEGGEDRFELTEAAVRDLLKGKENG